MSQSYFSLVFLSRNSLWKLCQNRGYKSIYIVRWEGMWKVSFSLESTNAAPEVPHPHPTRLPARRSVSAFFFFFFFLGFTPTRLDSCQCGSIHAELALICAELGWFGQNRAISGRISRRPILPKQAGNGQNMSETAEIGLEYGQKSRNLPSSFIFLGIKA